MLASSCEEVVFVTPETDAKPCRFRVNSKMPKRCMFFSAVARSAHSHMHFVPIERFVTGAGNSLLPFLFEHLDVCDVVRCCSLSTSWQQGLRQHDVWRSCGDLRHPGLQETSSGSPRWATVKMLAHLKVRLTLLRMTLGKAEGPLLLHVVREIDTTQLTTLDLICLPMQSYSTVPVGRQVPPHQLLSQLVQSTIGVPTSISECVTLSLQQCPNLRKLRLGGIPLPLEVTGSLPHLEEAALFDTQLDVVQALLSATPLRKLELSSRGNNFPGVSWTGHMQSPTLEELWLQGKFPQPLGVVHFDCPKAHRVHFGDTYPLWAARHIWENCHEAWMDRASYKPRDHWGDMDI